MSKRPNGEGSIYLRRDGLWVGSTFVLTSTGTRKRRYVYGKTRGGVHAKLTKLISQTQLGLPAAGSAIKIGPYLTTWLEQVASVKVRPSTYRAYETYVRLHLVPALGNKRLDRLSPSDVRMFVAGRQAAGLSSRTVQQLHAILRAALQHAVREDVIPRNVAKLVQVPAAQRIEVRPLSVAETRILLSAARSERLYALCVVLLAVGLRRGEVLGLRWVDIDLDGRTLRVRQTLQRAAGKLHFVPPKTVRSARTVPLPAVCVSALQEHHTKQEAERRKAGDSWQESGLVFTTAIGTPLEPRNVNRWFKALCGRAEVRPIRLHDLRHTCATFLLTQGVPARVVMEILGHSAINVTMNIYAHVLPEVQRAAADRLNELLSIDDDPGEVSEDH